MRAAVFFALIAVAITPSVGHAANALFATEDDDAWVIEVRNLQFVIHPREGGEDDNFDRIGTNRSFIDIRKRPGEDSDFTNHKRIKIIFGRAEEDPGSAKRMIRFTLLGEIQHWDAIEEEFVSEDDMVSLTGRVFVFGENKRLKLDRPVTLRADRLRTGAKATPEDDRTDDPCEEMPDEVLIEYSQDIGYEPPPINQ